MKDLYKVKIRITALRDLRNVGLKVDIGNAENIFIELQSEFCYFTCLYKCILLANYFSRGELAS